MCRRKYELTFYQNKNPNIKLTRISTPAFILKIYIIYTYTKKNYEKFIYIINSIDTNETQMEIIYLVILAELFESALMSNHHNEATNSVKLIVLQINFV